MINERAWQLPHYHQSKGKANSNYGQTQSPPSQSQEWAHLIRGWILVVVIAACSTNFFFTNSVDRVSQLKGDIQELNYSSEENNSQCERQWEDDNAKRERGRHLLNWRQQTSIHDFVVPWTQSCPFTESRCVCVCVQSRCNWDGGGGG